MEVEQMSKGKATGPSLRSEFGSAGVPNDGTLRFGGYTAVRGSAKTYAFSRHDKPGTQSTAARKPGEPGPSVAPLPLTETPSDSTQAPVTPCRAAGTQESLTERIATPRPNTTARAQQTAPTGDAPIQQNPYIGQSTRREIYLDGTWPENAGCPASGSAAPEYTAEPAQTPQPAVRRTTRVQSGPWVAIAVIAALLLGLVAGAFVYRLWADGALGFLPHSGDTEAVDKPTGLTPSEIYEACSPSVVGITAVPFSAASDTSHAPAAVAGTGFLISEDGYLLTNYHVVRGALELTVTLYDGRTCAARLVAWEERSSDLALLKIEESGLQPAVLGDSDSLKVGERVCTVGNPFGELSYSLTVGYISALDRTISTESGSFQVLQTDTAINSGSSGGPLFDNGGKIVGIVTAKYNSGTETDAATVEGLGFAIPINGAVKYAEAWMREDRQAGS